MKVATVKELRNEFPRIEAWLREGESVSISKRGTIIALLITPEQGRQRSVLPKPDIMARLRSTWGDRILSQAEVDAMRTAELEGE